jgi:alpha-1,6-mannosyltransferase
MLSLQAARRERLAARPAVRDVLASPVWRFGVLASAGFLLVLLETLRGSNQVFDFWEHAANVHQLILHPWNPGNALLAVHTPSAFFSPYALLVALAAKATGAGAVHGLAAAGLVNYWLLMAGIWSFTRVFSERRQAPFYALVFIWLLWGIGPWKYSGFFNLRALPAVITYPSTFATAIGMLTGGLWHQSVGRAGRELGLAAALTTLGLAVTVLTHPVAGVATAAVLLAISLTAPERGRSVLLLVAVAAAAAGLCLAWPYFSIIHLLQDQGVYDPSNSPMYDGWAMRMFPAFAALGLVFYATGTLRRARLGLYCLPLIALFIYGDASGHYGEGRVISYLVIAAQIGLADLAATVEQPLLTRVRGRRVALVGVAVAVVAAAELYNMRGGFRGSLPGTGSSPPVYAQYREAVDGLPSSATIAAQLNDGAEATIPAYAGRLIATHRPLAFIHDQLQRKQTVDLFFALTVSDLYRHQVIAQYRVRYIVVPTALPALAGELARFGRVIRRGSGFVTIAVGR